MTQEEKAGYIPRMNCVSGIVDLISEHGDDVFLEAVGEVFRMAGKQVYVVTLTPHLEGGSGAVS